MQGRGPGRPAGRRAFRDLLQGLREEEDAGNPRNQPDDDPQSPEDSVYESHQ